MFEDFVPHLEELRRRLIVSLVVFSRGLLDFLIAPLRRYHGTQLFFQEPFEAFLVHLKVAALSGLVISSPVLLTQAWLFVAPALYEREKKTFLPLIFASTGLFFVGVFFAYAFVIPWGLEFFLSFQTETLRPLLGIGPYFSFLIGMILAFGILFECPVVIIGLVRLGVVDTKTIAKARKLIIVFIFIAAAVLTPSPDPVSQLLLAIPLLAFFEISLAIARRFEKK